MTEALVFADGRLSFAGRTVRCALGRGGVVAAQEKQEGDGATPAALLPLRRVLFRADRVAAPKTTLPREPVGATDGWCDDAGHPDYNRFVRLPHPARHEELWRRDHVYDLLAVLGWNDSPVQRGRGSAIFLHLARDGYAPTEGCVAVDAVDLRWLLAEGVTALRVMG